MKVLQKDMEQAAKEADILKLSAAIEALQEDAAAKTELKAESAVLRAAIEKLQNKMEHVATKAEMANRKDVSR